MNSKQTPQQGQCSFEEGAENLSPGQGHSLDNQLKSHSQASVFLAAPFHCIGIPENLAAACQGWKCIDDGFMYLSPVAITREFYLLVPEVIKC